MINEKAFVLSHQSFWLGSMPMLPKFIRLQGSFSQRFSEPFLHTSKDNRGLIGELAFRLFARCHKNSCTPKELQNHEIENCTKQSIKFIKRLRAYSRNPDLQASAEGIDEALQLASILQNFFNSEPTAIELWPEFPGCGWLDTVEGDGLGDSTLYEIKCGKYKVRGKDIQQILCYLALNYASKKQNINQICVFNPRTGVVLRCPVELLCKMVSGTTSPELFAGIVEYISQPSWNTEGM